MRQRGLGILNTISELLDDPKLEQTGRLPEYSQSTSKNPDKILEDWMKPNQAVITPIEYPLVNLSDFEGRGYVLGESDRAISNRLLEGVGNNPLSQPIELNTGSNFMFHNPQVWSSGASVISRMMNQAKALKDQTGKNPIMLPRLLGAQGVDFDKNVGTTMMRYNIANAPTSTIKEQDDIIRKHIPNWRSANDPQSMQAFYDLPAVTRKQLQYDMDKLKNIGGLSLGNARLAITNPEYVHAPNQLLPAVAEIDVDKGTSKNTNINYPVGFHGEGLGLLSTPLTARQLTEPPEGFYNKAGDKVGEKHVEYYIKQANPSGILTREKLNAMSDAGIKFKSGLLPTAATLGTAAMSLLGSEEAEASGFGGFALKALERTQRKNPTTASGWKNALKGQGVKPKELQLMGFDNEFGFRKPDITKDEVAEFLKNNEYKIRETVLTDQPRYTVKGNFGREGFALYNPDGSVHSRYDTVSEARQKQFELNENVLLPEHEEFQLSPDDSENYRELLLKDDVNATKHEEITQEIKNLNDFIDAREDQLYDGILDAGGGQSELLQTKLDDPQVLDAMFKIAKLQQDRAELPYPFLTSHFNEQENILSHLRVADRQAVDDSNTLMVEEIQSDMHQRGSKVGYSKQPEINAMRDRRDALQEESDEITQGKWSITEWADKNMPEELDKLYMRSNQTEDVANEAAEKIYAARNKAYLQEFGESPIDRLGNLDRQLDNLRDKLSKAEIAVPDMPFKSSDKSSWYDLAFKRALVDAAEGDYDSISFTTGKTQGERWKGAADIKGVVNFYDNTLKNHINNWAKQYGVKLTPTKLKAKNKGYEVFYDENDVGWEVRDDDNIRVNADVNTEREAYEWIADKTGQEVLTLPITDKMRKELRDKGVSLFSDPLIGGATATAVTTGLLSNGSNKQTDNIVYDDRNTQREENRAAIEDMLARDAKTRRREELGQTITGILDAPRTALNLAGDAVTGLVSDAATIPSLFVSAYEKATPTEADAGMGQRYGDKMKQLAELGMSLSPMGLMNLGKGDTRKEELIKGQIGENVTSAVQAAAPYLRDAYTHEGLLGAPSIQDMVQATQQGYQSLPEGYLKDNALPAAGLSALGVLGMYDVLGLRRKAAQAAQQNMMPQGLLN